MIDRSVMVTGAAGLVGSMAGEFFARRPEIQTLYLTDLKKNSVEAAANNILVGASLQGYNPKIKIAGVDLTDVESTIKLLKKWKPGVIFNSASMFSSFWYTNLINKAMKTAGKRYRSRLAGHTIAKDFLLISRLMQAIDQSGLNIKVVNVAFPDNTHAVLDSQGLLPASGSGTIDLTVQGVRKAAADHLKIPMKNVEVSMISHHGIRVVKNITPDLFWCRITVGGNDVTDQFDLVKLITDGMPYSVGVNASSTASSGVKNTLAILNDSGMLGHAPGIKDAPIGGYPVRFTEDGARIVLPKGITKGQAKKINQAGLKVDGIERISSDGVAYFTGETCELLSELLGIERKSVKPSEAGQMTRELVESYKRLEKKYT